MAHWQDDPATAATLRSSLEESTLALARSERLLRIRTRQLAQAHELWCGAAEQALAGQPQSLRLRVDMHRAPPVEVVLSGEVA